MDLLKAKVSSKEDKLVTNGEEEPVISGVQKRLLDLVRTQDFPGVDDVCLLKVTRKDMAEFQQEELVRDLWDIRKNDLAYNPKRGFLEVWGPPSTLHDAGLSFFTDIMREHDKQVPEMSQLEFPATVTYKKFSGEWEGGSKVPDFAVRHKNNKYNPTVIVEIGFSEAYADLKDEMRMWLLGTGGVCKVGILIKLQEDPCWKRGDAVHSQPHGSSSKFGPLFIDQHLWVNQITGKIEFWRQSKTVIDDIELIERIIILPIQGQKNYFSIPYESLFGDYLPLSLHPLDSLTFSLDTFREYIKNSIEMLAEFRTTPDRSKRNREEDAEYRDV